MNDRPSDDRNDVIGSRNAASTVMMIIPRSRAALTLRAVSAAIRNRPSSESIIGTLPDIFPSSRRVAGFLTTIPAD